MLSEPDIYFLGQEEPVKSCLLFLRKHILQLDKNIAEVWKYGMPFYNYHGTRFCYLWVHKKHNQPYLGIVDGNKIRHPDLISENRSRMKILLIDPGRDIPLEKINSILMEVLAFCE